MVKKNLLLTTIILFIITAFSGCNNDRLKVDSSSLNSEYYTKINMWYHNKTTQETSLVEGRDRLYSDYTIYSTNYKSSKLLPLNTKITLLGESRNMIFFKADKKVFALKRTGHSKHVSLTTIFNRSFAKTPMDLNTIDSNLKELILKGEIKEGMSKDQIIISRGYPPEHRTRKLSNKTWYYWNSRNNKQKLEFEGENLIKIVD